MALNWYLNGINLKDYGIAVSSSAGIVDGLQMKSPFKVDLPDYHGEIVDLERNRYEPRDITLNCWIKASGMLDFTTKVNNFNQVLRKIGTHRFMIEIDPNKPLVYEVYFPDKTTIDKKWSDSTMIGTFSLKIREPLPIKKVLLTKGMSFDNRNLLLNSNFATKSLSPWAQTTTTSIVPDARFGYCCKAVASSLNRGIYQLPLREGSGDYAWSVWLKADAPMKCRIVHEGGSGTMVVSVTQEWQLFKGTGVWNGHSGAFCLYSNGEGNNFYIANAKYEQGNNSSDWTLAPEDVNETVSITLSCDELVNIYWGDGFVDYDIQGEKKVLTHEYSGSFDRLIIINGSVESIESITLNGLTEVWNIL